MHLEGARRVEVDRVLLGQRLEIARLGLDVVVLHEPLRRGVLRPVLAALALHAGQLFLDGRESAADYGPPGLELLGALLELRVVLGDGAIQNADLVQGLLVGAWFLLGLGQGRPLWRYSRSKRRTRAT